MDILKSLGEAVIEGKLGEIEALTARPSTKKLSPSIS